MPDYLIRITYRNGHSEFRAGNDARHTRRILAGLKGRYPDDVLSVFSIVRTEDVTAFFVKEA